MKLVIHLLAVATAVTVAAASGPEPSSLRVCADPNNLPFSNDREQGFENALATLVARELRVPVSYTWWAQRRGFLRNTLNASQCDVVMGMPSGIAGVLTTAPYYRSSYVFVTVGRRHLAPTSLDDPQLRRLRIGVQMIGDDFANSPPAHLLSARGMTTNIVGYSVIGDYSQPNPPARIIDAVAQGDIDVAVAWGPLAGYFARREPVRLAVTPVRPVSPDEAHVLAFDISMAVRKNDHALQQSLDKILVRRRAAIEALLDRYNVPRLGPAKAGRHSPDIVSGFSRTTDVVSGFSRTTDADVPSGGTK